MKRLGAAMLSLFQLMAALLSLMALFAWINAKFLRLPVAIGLTLIGLLASLILLGLGAAFPGSELLAALKTAVRNVSFYEAVINGMLGLLLFAGAIHVDVARLRDRAPVIALLAAAGVMTA